MTKYYRIIKDHPCWEVGAIISNINSDGYKPLEDFWNKIKDTEDYSDVQVLVENSPEFYERVYKTEGIKLAFKTAEQMKKMYAKFIA